MKVRAACHHTVRHTQLHHIHFWVEKGQIGQSKLGCVWGQKRQELTGLGRYRDLLFLIFN